MFADGRRRLAVIEVESISNAREAYASDLDRPVPSPTVRP